MLKDNQKIVAIAWEAKKQDLSYGMFSAMLTEESKIHIYKEYEELGSIPKERQKAMFQNRIF